MTKRKEKIHTHEARARERFAFLCGENKQISKEIHFLFSTPQKLYIKGLFSVSIHLAESNRVFVLFVFISKDI